MGACGQCAGGKRSGTLHGTVDDYLRSGGCAADGDCTDGGNSKQRDDMDWLIDVLDKYRCRYRGRRGKVHRRNGDGKDKDGEDKE